jgi:streptogramin lyase
MISEFPVPTPGSGIFTGMTLGPDAAVWFNEGSVDKIGRIQP